MNNPEDPSAGTRHVPFTREIYIEQDDFREDPPKKYFRLSPGKEVRLRYGYIIKCVGVDKARRRHDHRAALHLRSRLEGRRRADTKRVQATIHWVSAAHGRRGRGAALRSAVHERAARRRRHRLPRPRSTRTRSRCSRDCVVEPSLAGAAPETRFQFERLGYFVVDRDSTADRLVFNRTVTLRDQWAKINKGQKP